MAKKTTSKKAKKSVAPRRSKKATAKSVAPSLFLFWKYMTPIDYAHYIVMLLIGVLIVWLLK